MELIILIEQNENGLYVAKVPDIPGCYTQGKTISQALMRVEEAIQVCIEAEKEMIKPMKFVGLQQIAV